MRGHAGCLPPLRCLLTDWPIGPCSPQHMTDPPFAPFSLPTPNPQPKEIKDIRDFLQKARRCVLLVGIMVTLDGSQREMISWTRWDAQARSGWGRWMD